MMMEKQLLLHKNLHCPAGKFFIMVFFLTFAAVFELQKQRLLPTDLLFNLTKLKI